ncbi:2-acylglycerol O-acyltransferase [Acrasis kona]|uniref:Acyltransferase n=1 Tax=Acrasis kona TaxID=1008807 RepID=A0AAW2ZCM2_9EUKA
MIRVAPLNIPFSRRKQTAAVLFVCMLPLFLIWINLAFIFNPLLWWIYGTYLGYIYIYDRRASVHGNKRSKWFKSLPLFAHFRDYFPSKLIVKEKLQPGKPYFMIMHPHGIIGMSAWSNIFNETEGTLEDQCPGVEVRFVTLAVQFVIPFYRELIKALGLIDSSADTIRTNLNKNRAVAVMVGGAEESLYARPGPESIILSKRKGFVKIALQTGASLVPIYGFGENELYSQAVNPDGSLLRRIQENLKSITSFALPMFYGRGIFLYDYGLLPRRVPLTTVVGKPIPVPKIKEPTDADIEKYHNIYKEKLLELYSEHKGTAELTIL